MSNVALPGNKLFVAERTAVVVIRPEIFLMNFEEVVALAALATGHARDPTKRGLVVTLISSSDDACRSAKPLRL